MSSQSSFFALSRSSVLSLTCRPLPQPVQQDRYDQDHAQAQHPPQVEVVDPHQAEAAVQQRDGNHPKDAAQYR